jgi:hypothetical protein
MCRDMRLRQSAMLSADTIDIRWDGFRCHHSASRFEASSKIEGTEIIEKKRKQEKINGNIRKRKKGNVSISAPISPCWRISLSKAAVLLCSMESTKKR